MNLTNLNRMIAKNIGSLTAGLHFNAVLNMDIIHFLLTVLWCWGRVAGLARLEGGSCEIAGDQVGCSHRADGFVHVASSMTAEHVQHAAVQHATPPVLQAAKRQVPKLEKQQLLQPQHIPLEVGAGEHVASTVECYSFINFEDGAFVGCWLDGDGQVGPGFVGMAVHQLQAVPAVRRSSWIGGGLHCTAALVDGSVLTWGKAQECGIASGEKAMRALYCR